MNDRPVTENAASEKSVREAKKRFTQKRADQIDDLRTLLAQPQFRRVANRFIEWAGIYRGGYVEGEKAQYRDGMQNAGLFFIAELEAADPNALGLLRAQQHEDSKRS